MISHEGLGKFSEIMGYPKTFHDIQKIWDFWGKSPITRDFYPRILNPGKPHPAPTFVNKRTPRSLIFGGTYLLKSTHWSSSCALGKETKTCLSDSALLPRGGSTIWAAIHWPSLNTSILTFVQGRAVANVELTLACLGESDLSSFWDDKGNKGSESPSGQTGATRFSRDCSTSTGSILKPSL